MFKLNDHQQGIILTAAAPLHVSRRNAFVAAVAERLRALPEVGDGAVARACRETQRAFFDPPDLTGKGRSGFV